ncbi:MAG: hypothetical protein MUF04_00355, partial [Akkermansiaceae bacterium]|nr:hypothetical protein [Akkermansiaceae bacterium]
MNHPLEVVKRIGDKLIRDTTFEYRLEPVAVNHQFSNDTTDGLQAVDFGRTFGLGRPALALAWTRIVTPHDMEMTVHVEHSGGCALLLNGVEVYRHSGDRDFQLGFNERSLEMGGRCRFRLQRGPNSLCVISETRGNEWRFCLQPPSLKGAVVNASSASPTIGLAGVRHVDARIADLTNWLVIGPFANGGRRPDLPFPAAPVPEFGRMYPGLDGPVTWTIPKVEVLGAIIGWQPWGSLYHWSYYNGGTAWAMQHLSEATGETRFRDYAARYCDFHLEGIP